jgi:hypothetical protein
MEDVEFLALPFSIGAGALGHGHYSLELREEVVKLYAALKRPGNDLK